MDNNESNERKYSARGIILAILKSLGYFAVWYIIQIIVTSVASAFIMAGSPGMDTLALSEAITEITLELTVLSNALTLLLFAYYYKMRQSSFFEKIHAFKVQPRLYRLSAELGVCAAVSILFIISIIPFPQGWLDALDQNNAVILGSSKLMMYACTVLAAPLLEEILFRGLILGTLGDAMPKWIALILSSVAFGAVHVNPIGIVYATIFGFLLGWIFIRTKSVLTCIIVHALYNLTNLIFEGGIPYFLVAMAIMFTILLIIDIYKHTKGDEENEDIQHTDQKG